MRRRNFLWSVALAACKTPAAPSRALAPAPGASGPAGPAAGETPAAARRIAVDMHNHVYPRKTDPRLPQTPAPMSAGGLLLKPLPEGNLHPTNFESSGFHVVGAAYALDFARGVKPGDAFAILSKWLDVLDDELARYHLSRALVWKDVEAAFDAKKPILVQSVEGAQFIEGDLERLEAMHRRGLRQLQLVHDRPDRVSPLSNASGLTPMGVDVVKECERLGVLVDLAHASTAVVASAARTTRHPLLVSHTSLDSWTGSDPDPPAAARGSRPISREAAKTVADTGGVVGVWTKLTRSPKDYASSVKAMVDAIGVDHVGLGTDTDLLAHGSGPSTDRPWKVDVPGDRSSRLMEILPRELRATGLGEEDVTKILGGNYARVFRRVVG